MDGIKPPGRRGSTDFSGGTPVNGDSKGEMDGAGEGGPAVPEQVQTRNRGLDSLTLNAGPRKSRDRVAQTITAWAALDENGGPSERDKGWSEKFHEPLKNTDPAFLKPAPKPEEEDAEFALVRRDVRRAMGDKSPDKTPVKIPHQVAIRPAAPARARARARAVPAPVQVPIPVQAPQPAVSELRKKLNDAFEGAAKATSGKFSPSYHARWLVDPFLTDTGYGHHMTQLRDAIDHDKNFLNFVKQFKSYGVNDRFDRLFDPKKFLKFAGPEIRGRLAMMAAAVRKELMSIFDSAPDKRRPSDEEMEEVVHIVVASALGDVLEKEVPNLFRQAGNNAMLLKNVLPTPLGGGKKSGDDKGS